jgi:peptidoglycan/xylan/chitin deacetylase (PgdA/CDA1 family)
MDSHFEYGARVGVRRILQAVQQHAVPLTLNVCGRALETTPWIAGEALRHGYEMCCHGWRWEAHAGLDEAIERELIARCVRTITHHWGRAPVGWHTKSSPSVNTRRLVRAAGMLYDSDAYNDDAPYYVAVDGAPHLVLPYSFDTNDMRFFEGYQFIHARDFADYVIAAFETLLREGADVSRMMTVGLHTRIIGRPGRIDGLRQVLGHIARHEGVWLATREQIARHWLRHAPPNI